MDSGIYNIQQVQYQAIPRVLRGALAGYDDRPFKCYKALVLGQHYSVAVVWFPDDLTGLACLDNDLITPMPVILSAGNPWALVENLLNYSGIDISQRKP